MHSAYSAKIAKYLPLLQRIVKGVIDLCETKFTEKPFAVDEEYDTKLFDRREIFRVETRTSKVLHTVIISASGLPEKSRHGTIQALIVLDDLFISRV